ncbi:conserved hypothetical protein [Pseudomonas sp. 8Z]|uniref:DUF7931 domain-containing protein n=1 Tax=Pseudomonas sp. 8Z TaxID=2653166 RepID=UPI0012F3AE92|nr:histone acetyltransferase HPA2 [Pseudomonas sp. 8Z]VXD01052.1 conserved hypothetical protein [Pseudomonas sp. 8Z]
MDEQDAPLDSPELPPLEFESPGRFAILNPEQPLPDSAQGEPAPWVLGTHGLLERFNQLPQARAHALALIQQAQRSLCIYSDDLEPWLYHNASVQEACARLLLDSPRARLRILVRDISRAVKEGHRLLALSRRITSNLQIRKLNPDYSHDEQVFLLADNCGVLVRPEPAQYSGYALYNDPARARRLLAQFDQAWETSITDPDLRSFLL